MKKYIQYALVSMLSVLMWACSSDETGDGVQTRDGKVVLAKAVTFHVNFAGYNATQEVGTRATAANNVVAQKATVLDNGIVAVTTVQRDTTQQAPAATTRALDNGTYTMLAYQGGVFKGEVKGHISGGTFAYADNNAIELAPGTYDFVLINDKVTRTGNKITVKKDDMEQGLIGRTTYTVTATPQHQQVTFEMHPTAMRIKFRVLGYMNFTLSDGPSGKTGEFLVASSGSIPTKVEYDIANNTWTTVEHSAPNYSRMLTFPAATQDGVTYTSTNPDYVYYLPGQQSAFVLVLGKVDIYDRTIDYARRGINSYMAASVEPGTSYLLTIKFMMPAYYLMSDGSVGKTSETTAAGGTKTPIGVVLSRSKHLAIALEDAGKGAKFKWYKENSDENMTGDGPIGLSMYDRGDYMQVLDYTNGYECTWDNRVPAYDVPTRKGDNKTDFPAFYAAGHYGDELAAKVTLTNGMENKKWYLPGAGEWLYLYTVFGKGDLMDLNWDTYTWNHYAPCTVSHTNAIFTQVGGMYAKDQYWSSTQAGNFNYGDFTTVPLVASITPVDQFECNVWDKSYEWKVRAFVKY